MSPRKRTIEDLDDIDDEDGIREEQVAGESDLDLTVQSDEEAGLGGLPKDIDEEEER